MAKSHFPVAQGFHIVSGASSALRILDVTFCCASFQSLRPPEDAFVGQICLISEK